MALPGRARDPYPENAKLKKLKIIYYMRKGTIILFCVFIALLARAGDPVKDLIRTSGDSKDYPNDDLLILFDSTRTDVKESGLSYVWMHKLTKVLTAKGAIEMAVVKSGYDPLSAYTEIRRVVIHRKDGTSQILDVKNELDYPAPARAIYWGAREKMIEAGRLEPGDALEIEIFRKGFTYALLGEGDVEEDSKYIPPMKGQFYDIVEFWSSSPVKSKVYEVSVPKNKILQHRVYNGELQSSLIADSNKVVYIFSRSNFTHIKGESRMVAYSDIAPKLLVSTSPDWFAKSKWFYKVNEDFGSFDVTPDIQAKVDDILKGSVNELDSISRLTHWVADEIRYSGISMGCGEGYTLHKGEMTFSDRCGVCKDKAGMLITMLRAAGFKSYPAMTMAGSRIDRIPADQFNHSVTIVKLKDGKYHLLDPTWVPFVRELWSSAEQQQQYLMGVPEGADLMTTPLSSPENHYLKIDGSSEIASDGTLTGIFTLTAEGQTDAAVRGLFRNTPKSKWDEVLEKEMMKISPQARILNMEYSDPINYKAGPITIRITYLIPDFAIISDGKAMFTPVLASNLFKNVQAQLGFDTGIKERKYPFRDRCSRMIEFKEVISLPQGMKPMCLPDPKKSNGSSCSYDCNYSVAGDTLVLSEKIILGKRIYEATDWPDFRDAVNAQNYFAETPVILKQGN